MNIKKELKLGGFLSLLVLGLAVFFINQYQQNFKSLNQKSLTTNQPTASVTLVLDWQEIKKHNNPADCWLVIDQNVYDLTNYAKLHPGGEQGIYNFCGQDASQAFATKGGKGSHSNKARQDLASLLLGKVGETVNYQKQQKGVPVKREKELNDKKNKDKDFKLEDSEK